MLLHSKLSIPQRASPVADLRQVPRLLHRCANARKLLTVTAQAASTVAQRKAATETADAKPTSSEDTTHVPIETGEPTDPDHVSSAPGSSGPDIEVDSVLAKELSENGTSFVLCDCYGDQSSRQGVTPPSCCH